MRLAQITAENKITNRQHKYLQKQGLTKDQQSQPARRSRIGGSSNKSPWA
jgi:hypothetical protein